MMEQQVVVRRAVRLQHLRVEHEPDRGLRVAVCRSYSRLPL